MCLSNNTRTLPNFYFTWEHIWIVFPYACELRQKFTGTRNVDGAVRNWYCHLHGASRIHGVSYFRLLCTNSKQGECWSWYQKWNCIYFTYKEGNYKRSSGLLQYGNLNRTVIPWLFDSWFDKNSFYRHKVSHTIRWGKIIVQKITWRDCPETLKIAPHSLDISRDQPCAKPTSSYKWLFTGYCHLSG